MRRHVSDEQAVMRLNITLARDEHPELFAALVKVGKGIRRAQRLKTLASERLVLAERWASAKPETEMSAAGPGAASPVLDDDIRAAQELFLPPMR